jgi:hypothetical protein
MRQRLTADVDADTRRVNIDAVFIMVAPVFVTIANDHSGVGILDAFGNACSIVADLPAHPFGIGGVREGKPDSRRRHANQKFAHSSPPSLLFLPCLISCLISLGRVWFQILPQVAGSSPGGHTAWRNLSNADDRPPARNEAIAVLLRVEKTNINQ